MKTKLLKSFRACLSISLCLALVPVASVQPAYAASPSITVNAASNEGIISPNATGNMFEWASDYLNNAWAERAINRNFEVDSVDGFSTPLYDHFSGGSLNRSKWTPAVIGGSMSGSYSESNSNLILNGGTDSRYGLLSRTVQNAVLKDTTVKADIVSISGLNGMLSIYSGDGTAPYNKFIEFGIENGVLKVYGDGLTPWVGGAATLPASLKIVVGHQKGNVRDISFYYNNTQVYSVSGFSNIGEHFRVMIYGWGTGTTVWDSLSIYQNDLYDHFDGTSLNPHFTPALLAGSNPGSIAISGSDLSINGSSNCRYGVLSDRIRNSAVDWTEVEAKVDSISGMNALINIYGGSGSGDFSHFVEYGIEGGVLKVFSDTGQGNWSGESVTLPGVLKIQISPYYANGRDFRFYWNGELVYAYWQAKNVPQPDYRVFLYGYGNSVSKWDYVNISQQHFTDSVDPHFEGSGLPGGWAPITLEGGYGSIDSHDSFCKITGAANSRFGVAMMPYADSDIKPYRVSALLTSYSGRNGLLHLTTDRASGSMGSHFVEFGIEDGALKVFTPTSTWVGPTAACPAKLDIYVSAYAESGRTLTFVYNGEPVYQLDHFTALGDAEYSAVLYGYGTSVTTWDFCDAYPMESWTEDGYDGAALYSLDDSSTAVSGTYSQKIQVLEANSGRKGISQPAVDVKSGKNYQISMWLKQNGNSSPVQVTLGPDQPDSPDYVPYAGATITGASGTFQKYTVNLVSNTTDTDAKLFVGTQGPGTLWIDQISIMPTDPSEVSYGYWRKDFIDRLTELKPYSLRWPGGIIADSYLWTNGIGTERDKRPPLFYAQWNAEWMSNDVGIDEFLQLCEELGIKPTININYGQGTPADCANFLEYVNGASTSAWGSIRASNGHPQPYGVQTWEIGNEVWGGWTPGHTDAQTYANNYLLFRNAMAAKDPTIRFIGEGGDGNSTDQSWNTTMVRTAGDYVNELSIHYYSPQGLPQGYSDSDVYKASVAAPVSIKDRLKTTQSVILSNSNEDIKEAVTEYNAMYFNSEFHRTRTMEAAIQVAGQLNAFLSDPAFTDHNDYSCLANFWDGSTIRLGQRGNFVIPSFYVLKLYADERGPMKVNSASVSDTFDSPSIGNVPALTGVPYLESFATRSMDGSKLYLSVINRNNEEGYTVPIAINGVSGVQPTANVYTLTSNNYLDMNSWANPNLVPLQQTQIQNAAASFQYTFAKNSVTVFEFTISGLSQISGPVLTGQVIGSDGAPLQGATVSTNTNVQTITDSKGFYMLSVPSGTYNLVATKSGYSTASKNNVYVYPDTGTTAQPIQMS